MIKVNLYLDETLWREFRVRCIRRGISASKAISAFIREEEERLDQLRRQTPGFSSSKRVQKMEQTLYLASLDENSHFSEAAICQRELIQAVRDEAYKKSLSV